MTERSQATEVSKISCQRSVEAVRVEVSSSSIPTTIPGFPGAAGSRVDAGESSSAVGFAHDPAAFTLPLNQLGLLQWQKGVNGHRHGTQCMQFASRHTATTAALHTGHPPHPKCAVHSPPASIRPRTARFFVSSPAVAMLHEVSASAEAGGAPDGVAENAIMDGIFGDEELERVFESIGEAEDSGLLESVKREAQGVLQLATKRRIARRPKP